MGYMKFKPRLIFATITFLVVFIGSLYYKTKFEIAFLIGVGFFVFVMVLGSKTLYENDRARAERMREEERIKREEYLKETARQEAREDFEERQDRPFRTGLEPSGFTEMLFGGWKRGRKRKKK